MTKPDDGQLLPCPMCGGNAELNQTGKNQLTVECKNCHLKRQQKWLNSSKEWLENHMIKAWNTRHQRGDETQNHALASRFRTMLNTANSKNPWETHACELMSDMLAQIDIKHKSMSESTTQPTQGAGGEDE